MAHERADHPPADPVRDLVFQGIADGTLRFGAKLPTERELAVRFGRPRSAVRKTLTVLEAEGWIVRNVGRGTFVSQSRSASDPAAPQVADPDTSPAQLIAARLVLEPELVGLTVANATTTDLRHIIECWRRGVEATTLADFDRWDRALHRAIAQATHNGLIIRAFDLIDRARDTAEWGTLKTSRHLARPERRAAVHREHEAIVLALRERDGERARQVMLDHLLGVRQNLLGY